MIEDTYQTIESVSEALFKDKGSKFIAIAVPVETEEQIKELLIGIKKKYHDARHHCYAWVLGSESQSYRINDDGEPSGTAGRPIYGQIVSSGLTNVVVFVVRYFGGKKLGVRGLINAYKESSRSALQQANIVTKIRENKHHISFDYKQMNEVMKITKNHGLTIIEQHCKESCSIIFSVRLQSEPLALNELQRIQGISLKKL